MELLHGLPRGADVLLEREYLTLRLVAQSSEGLRLSTELCLGLGDVFLDRRRCTLRERALA
eukprot:8386941-Alexandrium_andersonii.AAC.1